MKRRTLKPRAHYLPVLSLIIVGLVSAGPTRADILDQWQTQHDYGFWFEQTIERWQEVVPALPTLTRVTLGIYKRGIPGDMIVSIVRVSDAAVLGTATVPGAEISSGFSWTQVLFDELIHVTPGEKLRIVVTATEPSPDTSNRFFWDGQTDTDPYPLGDSSAWLGFDFAFRTYGTAETPVRTVGWSHLKRVF